MRFVIGGRASGKNEYVKNKYGAAEIPDADFNNIMTARAVKNFHIFVRENISTDIRGLVDEICEKNPDIIIISDEVGCGVVPSDDFEREWRERAGRANCYIADRADEVVRVVCGIGTVIK